MGAEELSAKWFPQKQKRVAGDLKVRGPTSSYWLGMWSFAWGLAAGDSNNGI